MKKFKFPRRAGAVSAVMLIAVGALLVYLTRAAPGDSPILVTEEVSSSGPNQVTYIVKITNITEQQIRNVRLNIQLPEFKTGSFTNLGTSTYVGATDLDGNSIPVRPAGNPTTSMGANPNCTGNFTDSGWYTGLGDGAVSTGCPHYAWKIATLSQFETRVFTYTVTIKKSGIPGQLWRFGHFSQAYFTGTFTSRLSASGMPLNQKLTTSYPVYTACVYHSDTGWVCSQNP